MWDDEFEQILRTSLPFLGDDEELKEDTDLRSLGLDSMGTVDLLAKLEKKYDVRFLDEALSMETFATPRSLWTTLSTMTGSTV
ncbi:phosphopantetheine-binding protein [Streptosporangium sp. NBC_01639]|uniref:phosphopantetheine-binding protein n=1 Tax=unclassified Streptosporangium TaxID=2632669 RepID=UPI002DD9CC7E|nr:phosphopantetheine-binding protein [Streptosporangium sp. NBC_01756]WSC88651.1 phosphopantetheine-binding protein [Streptosporangium sp. NBC_01756]WTD52657.1 phosphopantetheine-binding protein [Streptosporangium sp. NBC_01639]